VNDAPALIAADVGSAIGGHKNVALSIASSDIVILGDDAGDLLTALDISGKMAEITKQNYACALSFNTVGLALATFGFLNPVLAALLHPVSSVFAVANAARLYCRHQYRRRSDGPSGDGLEPMAKPDEPVLDAEKRGGMSTLDTNNDPPSRPAAAKPARRAVPTCKRL
jgi:hypothetical protein